MCNYSYVLRDALCKETSSRPYENYTAEPITKININRIIKNCMPSRNYMMKPTYYWNVYEIDYNIGTSSKVLKNYWSLNLKHYEQIQNQLKMSFCIEGVQFFIIPKKNVRKLTAKKNRKYMILHDNTSTVFSPDVVCKSAK